MGGVPYQALLLLRYFAYKIRAREQMRKGEGEPGDEARFALARVEFIKGTSNSSRDIGFSHRNLRRPFPRLSRSCTSLDGFRSLNPL